MKKQQTLHYLNDTVNFNNFSIRPSKLTCTAGDSSDAKRQSAFGRSNGVVRAEFPRKLLEDKNGIKETCFIF